MSLVNEAIHRLGKRQSSSLVADDGATMSHVVVMDTRSALSATSRSGLSCCVEVSLSDVSLLWIGVVSLFA